jgi:hypothetical protein
LAYLLNGRTSGIPQIDSLNRYKNLGLDKRLIWSGAPALPVMARLGGGTYEYVYPVDSKYSFSRRFLRYYDQNTEIIRRKFKEMGIDIAKIIDMNGQSREEHIYQAFQSEIIPLLDRGQQVYSNYGYAHIFQKEIYGSCFLACRIKNEFPEIKIASVLGLLSKSTVMKQRNWKKSKETIQERGLTFDRMVYNGYKTSNFWDGDSFFEKLKGVRHLNKVTKSGELVYLDLNKKDTPFKRENYLVKYQRGGKEVFPSGEDNTLQYFQYIVFMKGSRSATPLEEEKSDRVFY